MNALQWMIWEDLVNPMWKERNSILHNEDNYHNVVEDRKLTEKIKWYRANKHALISRSAHFLARQNPTDLTRMTRRTKKELLYHLDEAAKKHKATLQFKDDNQRQITEFFHRLEEIT